MLMHPAWRTIFKPRRPFVEVHDIKESVSDLTTYTFTSCQMPIIGTSIQRSSTTADFDVQHRSPSHRTIMCIVHGEDAAITFGVSGVTLGGVAGSEDVDSAGASASHLTSIYRWHGLSLDTITTTDVVVTFTEAVTSCAICLLSVYNVPNLSVADSSDTATSGTGDLVLNTGQGSANTFYVDGPNWVVSASTCATGGGTETPEVNIVTQSSIYHPTLLYQRSNAEMDYAAWFTWSPQYNADNRFGWAGQTVSWSGAGSASLVAVSGR